MGTGVSLFFIAVGAILAFAIDANTEGFNLDAIGVILMIIGLIGLLWSLVLADDWRPGRRRTYDDVVVDEDVPAERTVRRVYR
ncbi:MAG TPA: DUF6458 family protein [Acidimicrobiia bacterium]|nr:DUF6458 family protein [Acidimicrobiia bacterium]